MPSFTNDGFELNYEDEGEGDPVLMIHGFASSLQVNWMTPGWFKTLREAGYRAIAFDHRGHGKSSKSYDRDAYTPDAMAGDAVALLDHLDIEKTHVLGYSMGARVSAFMVLRYPERVASVAFGGLGMGMVDGVGDWDPIAEALNADDVASVTHPRGLMFRKFADATRSDRKALAACIARSRDELTPEQIGQINQPALVAVGTADDIAGAAAPFAALMPNGESFDIEGRDHMLSVGDRTFKKRYLEFLGEHPLKG
ncbi:alpha/beta fold hydrolase [Limoniibacter endophyticus]|uniref:Alpha/beta hydrolase n=1 Tax=Limoniibacter endophyticus TaxID=1565040 RepID=A0A8J3DKV5_9HYPH|nr:alpha/beta hydrolase [Limoniibacter endophyticus]GHC62008.1 alpha/beta hydrolase [Limoniibacter endophyticus]